jgi:hypothetical protein
MARMSGVSYRTYIRPGKTGPAVGKRISWQLTQPIQDLLDQGKKHGFRNLGTVGDAYHLAGDGDHTPWSRGKKWGWVYAKDTSTPADFEKWLVATCKSNYDTRWIHFFNINNRQYDYAGNLLGWSGDSHFHVSVKNGYENTRVTLFDDYVKSRGAGSGASLANSTNKTEESKMALRDEKFNVDMNADGKLEERRLADVVGWLVGKQIEHDRQFKGILAQLTALTAKTTDTEALAQALVSALKAEGVTSSDPVSTDELEAALRRVFQSVPDVES